MTDNFEIKATIKVKADQESVKQAEREMEANLHPKVGVNIDYKEAMRKMQADIAGKKATMTMEGLVAKHGTNDLNKITEAETAEATGKANAGPDNSFKGLFATLVSKGPQGAMGSVTNAISSSGAGAGMAGGAMVAGIMGIKDIAEKLYNFLLESSPLLTGAVKMITKALLFFIMPIANLIARILMPIAKTFMKASIDNLKKGGGSADVSGLSGVIASTLSAMMVALVPLFGEIAIQVLPAFAPYLLGAFLVAVPVFLAGLLLTIMAFNALMMVGAMVVAIGWPVLLAVGLAGILVVLLAMFGPQIWGFMTSVGQGIMDALSGLGTWLWNTLISLIQTAFNIYLTLGKWLWDTLISLIQTAFNIYLTLGKWLWDCVVGIFTLELNVMLGLGKWLWDTLVGVFGAVFKAVTDAVSGIGNLAYKTLYNALASIPNGIRDIDLGWPIGKPFQGLPSIAYLADGGIATQATNAVVGEAGPEAIIPLDKLGGMLGGTQQGGTTHLHLTIQGDVFGVSDLEKTVTKIFDKNMARMSWR